MIRVGRVISIREVIGISRISGVPILSVKVSFDALEFRTRKAIEVEVLMMVYEDQPLSVVDSHEYCFSCRAKRVATSLIKEYLKCWDGVEFDGEHIRENSN